MELMSKYEMVFVVSPDATEEAAKALFDKFTGIVTDAKGTIDKVDEWGKKRLAYPINDLTEGIYYVVDFTANADVPAELDRVFQITDGILRSIIVKIGE